MNNNYEYFVVRSEGGLGAQIVAASAYYYLKSLTLMKINLEENQNFNNYYF